MMLQLKVGGVLGRSLSTYFKNFIPFTILSALVHVPSLLVILAITGDDATAKNLELYDRFGRILDMLLANIASGAMAYGVFHQLQGKRVGMVKSLTVGLIRLLPVLGVGLLCAIIIGLGYLALVIPGVILSCMLFVAVPAAVVERPGLFGALKRSKQLTDGHKGSIFGILFLQGLMLFGVLLVVGVALFASANRALDEMRTFLIAVWATATLFGAWQSVAVAVVYHDLRQIKDGITDDDLVKIFE